MRPRALERTAGCGRRSIGTPTTGKSAGTSKRSGKKSSGRKVIGSSGRSPFLVPKPEIAGNDYDLSINRYKEVAYEAVEYDSPNVILKRLAKLEEEIEKGRKELEGMLKLPRQWS